MPDLTHAKRALRRRLRTERLQITEQARRSQRIGERLQTLIDPAICRTVMLYEPIPGEPDLEGFADWCRSEGITVVCPTPDRNAAYPADPAALDAIVVPGLAFTPDGDRIGQGAGWYDRLLPLLPNRCLRIGVCFAEQVVTELPVEPHDARLDVVVSDEGVEPAGPPRHESK